MLARVEVLGLMFIAILLICISNVRAEGNSILVNCGANESVNVDGRRWIGDSAPNTNFTVSSPGTAVSAASGDGPLYQTARVFSSGLNYTFEGVQGDYFLRLHFCSFLFGNYNVNESSFSVVANGLQLVSEFNVPHEITAKSLHLLKSDSNSSSLSTLVKEYILGVNLGVLVIEFTPSKGSFGFINAIEIVPVLDTLVTNSVNKVGGSYANINLNGRGIEAMYRLNVGGPEIKPHQDSNLWRVWNVDSSYMIMADAGVEINNSSNITDASTNDSSVAPLLVYETARTMSNTQVLEKRFNMSWKFGVHPGFDYLVRLHFCELEYNRANQRIFRIYVNNRTAADNFDVFVRAGGKNRAYHQDYLDLVSSAVDTLWVQLGPDTTVGAAGTDALLNGLEIFKLSRNGNLAYAERSDSTGNHAENSKSRVLLVGIGAGLGSVLILAVILTVILTVMICFCKKRRRECSDTKSNSHGHGWRPLFMNGAVISSIANAKGGAQSVGGSTGSIRAGKRFTLAEIRAATNNFDDSLVIGVGGFGKVYKGVIEDGTLTAVKRANPQSDQGLAEFETEIELLSKLRHRHLVSLIGFCEEHTEMILVYEYMANGTLRSHLFGSNLTALTWKQRLEVCIGAARGLHYLHTGADRGIIHRDVKTTNILLDEKFVAKMSDFGLSKTGPAWDHTHVSTAVKGSFGYLDPEYFRRQQLTEKSDVYSFGVVLFEVVCSRPVINPTLPRDEINLAEWAMK